MDPREHRFLWLLIRCTGGADAWLDPFDDPKQATADRVASWTAAVGMVILVLTIVGAVLMEVVR